MFSRRADQERLIGSNCQKRRSPRLSAAVTTNGGGGGGGKGRGKGRKKVLKSARKRNGGLASKATTISSKCKGLANKATTGTSTAAGVELEHIILSDSDDDGLEVGPPSRTKSQTPMSNKRKLSRLQDEAAANCDQYSTNEPSAKEEPILADGAATGVGNSKASIEHKDEIHTRDPPSYLPEKRLLELVLDVLQRKDSQEIFAQPVDASEVEDYYEIIKEPMDFGTMRAKLHEGMYRNLQQFEYDVFLIFQNAMHFNSSNTVYFKQARVLDELAKNVFSVLKTDPRRFEQEFAFTHRRLTRKLCADNRDQNFSNPSSKVGKNFRTNNCTSNLDAYSSARGYKGFRGVDVNSTSTDFNRRFTYKQPWTPIGAEQLIQINQQDLSYKESLMLFVKDLGPIAQKVAKRKLQQELLSKSPISPSIQIPHSTDYQTDHPLITSNSQLFRASLQPSYTLFQFNCQQLPSFGTAPVYAQTWAHEDNSNDTNRKAREIPMMNFSEHNKSGKEGPPRSDQGGKKNASEPAGPSTRMDISCINNNNNNNPAGQVKRRRLGRKREEEEGGFENGGVVLAVPAVVPGMDYGFQRRKSSAPNFCSNSNGAGNLNTSTSNNTSRPMRRSRNEVKVQEGGGSGKSNPRDREKSTPKAKDLDHQKKAEATTKVERNHLTNKLDLNQAFGSGSQLTFMGVPKAPQLASALQDQHHVLDSQSPAALRLGSGQLRPQLTTTSMGAGPTNQFHFDLSYFKSRLNGGMGASFDETIGNSNHTSLLQDAAASTKHGYSSFGVMKASSPFQAAGKVVMSSSATEHNNNVSSSNQLWYTGEHSAVLAGTNLPDHMSNYHQQELALLQNLQGKFGIPRFPCRM